MDFNEVVAYFSLLKWSLKYKKTLTKITDTYLLNNDVLIDSLLFNVILLICYVMRSFITVSSKAHGTKFCVVNIMSQVLDAGPIYLFTTANLNFFTAFLEI